MTFPSNLKRIGLPRILILPEITARGVSIFGDIVEINTDYRGFLQAAVPSKSRLGRQKGLAAV